MFGKNIGKNKGDPTISQRGPRETCIYPLESIMRLQKALENGIEQEEKIRRKRLHLSGRDGRRSVLTDLLWRVHTSFIGIVAELRYRLRPNYARRKQFKKISAR